MNESEIMSIIASGYEGWVAWIDGSPIFEAVPVQSMLAPVASGLHVTATRPMNRAVREWKDLPNGQIDQLELYFARDKFPGQPVFRVWREPGSDVRMIQMKLGGVVFMGTSQQRLGVIGYRVGFWNRHQMLCQVWEFRRDGSRIELPPVRDPTLPRPEGYGYAPHVVGMTRHGEYR